MEFALLAVPFLFIVFATLEVAMLFIAELGLDGAVDRVGREVRTGQLTTDDMTEAKFRKRLCASMPAILDCGKLKIDLRSYPTYASINPAPPTDGSYQFDIGGPNEIMALRVYYHWPLLTDIVRAALSGGTGYRLASVAAFRTESY